MCPPVTPERGLPRASIAAVHPLQAVEGDKAPRDTHRKKAIDLLTRAQGEILKAKDE